MSDGQLISAFEKADVEQISPESEKYPHEVAAVYGSNAPDLFAKGIVPVLTEDPKIGVSGARELTKTAKDAIKYLCEFIVDRFPYLKVVQGHANGADIATAYYLMLFNQQHPTVSVLGTNISQLDLRNLNPAQARTKLIVAGQQLASGVIVSRYDKGINPHDHTTSPFFERNTLITILSRFLVIFDGKAGTINTVEQAVQQRKTLVIPVTPGMNTANVLNHINVREAVWRNAGLEPRIYYPRTHEAMVEIVQHLLEE